MHGEHGGHDEHGSEGPHGHDEHGFAQAALAIGLGERRRRLARRLRLGVLVLGGLLCVTELLLRTASPAPGALGPRVDALGLNGGLTSVSTPGLRYDWAPPTPSPTSPPVAPDASESDARTILCLGPSVLAGAGLAPEETLAARLAARAEVRAAGEPGPQGTPPAGRWRARERIVPGYTLGQLRRACALEEDLGPEDLVLLVLTEEEVESTGYFLDRTGRLRRDFLPLPDSLRRLLWNWSALYGAIARWHARQVEEPGESSAADPLLPYAFARAENREAARAELEKLREQCRTRGTPLFVLELSPLEAVGAAPTPAFEDPGFEAWAEGLRRALGLPGLSLLAPALGGENDAATIEALCGPVYQELLEAGLVP